MGYSKNVAVIKGLKDGFSMDGGALSGLIKAEKYSAELRVEVSLINFAPLTEGRYVAAISDGANCEVIENCLFEGASAVDTGGGFAAVICYVNGGVQLIASAVCGGCAEAALTLKETIERAENLKTARGGAKESAVYEDEAIAEVNYYELDQARKDGEPLRQDKKEEKTRSAREDEKGAGAFQNRTLGGLAGGNFFERMKGEIDGLFAAYPPSNELCAAIEGSKWVRISYGDDKYYVFGVIYSEGNPKYICYGVPAENGSSPPESMKNLASFLPVKSEGGEGYWIMYQDADTGASISVSGQ